jgi:predicted phage terminase large subunit-like protein
MSLVIPDGRDTLRLRPDTFRERDKRNLPMSLPFALNADWSGLSPRSSLLRGPVETERPPGIERAEFDLRAFIAEAWSVVEPGTPFVPGYHIDAIAQHLQAITDGQIRNLLVNVPPRHGKSSLVCVMWPAWEWITHPAQSWLFSSYGLSLAIRDSIKCRRLIESPWYRLWWGDRYRLTSDQNQKMRYDTDARGYRLATSVGGHATGEGANRIVVDDPLKIEDAESDAVREGANEWWDQTMSTRGNNPATVARVVIQQRLHENDLSGHVLERMRTGGEQYEHLVLPARYEPRIQVTGIGWTDPRTEEGELLWPKHFPEVELAKLEATLGPKASGQLQQRPTPAGGATFKTEWWAEGRNRFDPDVRPHITQIHGRWLFFDTALKEGQANDYTACTGLEVTADYQIRVVEQWKDRLAFPELLLAIERSANKHRMDGKLKGVVIEDKVSGTSAIQTMRGAASPAIASLIEAWSPTQSKEYRAGQAAIWCWRDGVLLPHPAASVPWLGDFEYALEHYPALAHDDDIDSFTMGILFLEHFLERFWQARLARFANLNAEEREENGVGLGGVS